MGFENVEKAVLEEARAEAAEIVADARSRLAERLELEKRELDRQFAARRRRRLARLDSEHHRELSRARTDARLEVLKRKNAMVEAAFEEALRMLGKLPAEKFLELAAGWLAGVPGELSGKICAAERERSEMAGAFLKKVNAGRKGKLEISDEHPPEGGGLVVRAERFEFDFSWAERLDDRRGTLAPEVAAVLFAGDASKT
ncbi:MAG: V-type ATP synthase subunit E family protein [Planctomycetota bacterium]|jgi:vacuolar-type H+-ATPase subunit E/Vma4